MDTSIFFGGSVLAAVVAGSIALFAPCCISVMLPAYFASSFQNRRLLVAMTFLFAAGVGTVVLPNRGDRRGPRRHRLGCHVGGPARVDRDRPLDPVGDLGASARGRTRAHGGLAPGIEHELELECHLCDRRSRAKPS